MITNRKCPIMTIALGDVEECWGLECMWCKHTEFGRVCAVSGEKMYVEDGTPDALTTLTAENAALKAADKWIPVMERLPEQSGRYLAYIHREATEVLGGNSDFIRVKMFMGGEWAYGTHSPAWINGELKDTVTHWRPLPAAPEV